jgi:glutathione S-transferase
MIELYFGPGACSFVPHVALEIIKARTGEDFTPHMVKLHKQEQRSPEYLAMNPDGLVPMLRVGDQSLTQIVAICDYLDRRYPQVGLLPSENWARAQAMSQLAWMNNTAHPSFTHVFMPHKFAETEATQAELKRFNAALFRKHLERVQGWVKDCPAYWLGDQPTFHDAYALTLLRWGGFAGIDPDSLPQLKAFVDRVAAAPAVASAMERERLRLDTFKKA